MCIILMHPLEVTYQYKKIVFCDFVKNKQMLKMARFLTANQLPLKVSLGGEN